MEGAPDTPPFPVKLESNPPAVEIGPTTTLFLDNGTPGVVFTNPVIRTSEVPGIPRNLPPGPAPTISRSVSADQGKPLLGVEIPMTSSQGIYDVMSVSFAYGANGNGYAFVQLQMSTDGGLSFTTNLSGLVALPATPGAVITFAVPTGTTLNINNLVLRNCSPVGVQWPRSPVRAR